MTVAETRLAWEVQAEEANRDLDANVDPIELNDVSGEIVTPIGTASARHSVLHLHGGGYIAGSCQTHRALAAGISTAAGCPVVTIDYRLAPEHPCPAVVDDAETGHRWLLDQGYKPADIVLVVRHSSNAG